MHSVVQVPLAVNAAERETCAVGEIGGPGVKSLGVKLNRPSIQLYLVLTIMLLEGGMSQRTHTNWTCDRVQSTNSDVGFPRCRILLIRVIFITSLE